LLFINLSQGNRRVGIGRHSIFSKLSALITKEELANHFLTALITLIIGKSSRHIQSLTTERQINKRLHEQQSNNEQSNQEQRTYHHKDTEEYISNVEAIDCKGSTVREGP